jgi:NAD(P)-dependent dehydrogenase (short-subunit alcohol dehydrogenase family)
MRMQQKPTTLITGAGKRIGAAIAQHLASAGHHLILHYHTSHAATQALADDLRERGATVTLVQADLSDTATLATFWRDLPACHHLIHNASRYTRDTIRNFTPADLRAHLAVNLEAPLLLTQGFLAQRPTTINSHVIVLGDGALGWSISPEFFSYAVSKHAWASLVDLLAASCAPHTRVNLLALAPTLPNENDSAEMFARLAAASPLARTGAVDDVLAAIDYLLRSDGITGQTIGLGNGMGLATKRP